ncbi:MAG: hypothetical protein ACK417_03470 [Bacteroidia bacterium]
MDFLLKYKKSIAGILLGTLAGYAYWHFYGCVNGCTITGSALNSSLYFGFMGYLVAGMFKSPPKQEADNNKKPQE